MSNTVFKTRIPQSEEKPVEMIKDENRVETVKVQVDPPFTSYEKETGKPYIVDHFGLGEYWNVDQIYTKEVDTMNKYLNMLIDRRQIDDTLTSVKAIIKKISKTAGVEETDTKPIKVGKIAAYMKFLLDTDHIKLNARKYGYY